MRLGLRTRVLAAVGAAMGGLATPPHRAAILWNATASAPLGVYGLSSPRDPAPGMWVVLRPPPGLADWIAARGYAPAHVPLLKRVAAATGQEVCRRGARVSVDGRPVALAAAHDRRGRSLPAWAGCRRLREGEVLLLNPAAGSLDGRYFGVSRAGDVIARATPLWTWPAR